MAAKLTGAEEDTVERFERILDVLDADVFGDDPGARVIAAAVLTVAATIVDPNYKLW